MTVLMTLFIAVILIIVTFSIIVIKVVKSKDYKRTVEYLDKYIVFIFALLFILYVLSIILTGVFLFKSELMIIVFIKYIIHFIFFVKIFIDSKALLLNLKNDAIFVESNEQLTRQIGISFIYLAITEVFAGITLAIIRLMSNSSYKEFRIESNTTLVLFLVIGLILLIVSFVLQKAIEIYKEHNLTI